MSRKRTRDEKGEESAPKRMMTREQSRMNNDVQWVMCKGSEVSTEGPVYGRRASSVSFEEAARCPNVKEVVLGSMSAEDMEKALEELGKVGIESLIIKGQIGGFGHCLRYVKGLKSLTLADCTLGEDETVELMEDLEGSTVETFSVDNPCGFLVTETEHAALCRALVKARCLRAVRLPIKWFRVAESDGVSRAIAGSAIETLGIYIDAMWVITGSYVLMELARAIADAGALCRLRAVNLGFSHIASERDLERLANAMMGSDHRVSFNVAGCTYGYGDSATRYIDHRLLQLVIKSAGQVEVSGVHCVRPEHSHLVFAAKEACDSYENRGVDIQQQYATCCN